MIKKQVGRLRLEIYNGIDELPIERYHKFNLYCLMSAGIGNDIKSINEHITDIYGALNRGDTDRLKVQFQNYYHALHLIVEGEDMQSMAYACLVNSINETEVKDISEDGLREVSKRIAKAEKRQRINALVNELKKKSRTNLRYIFRRKRIALK